MTRLLAFLAALMLPSLALAQTTTITSPNTVNPQGYPKPVTDVFVRNPDGSIATVSGGGSGGSVAQGSTTAGQSGPLVQCTVVTGNQTYVVGTTNPLNCITNGRLKVGVSNAGNVDPATMLTTTLTADLAGCKSYATRPAWADQYTGSIQCDLGGNLQISETPSAAASQSIVPTTVLNATSLTAKASAGNFYGASLTNSTVAGYMVVANLAAAPTSGTALTAAQVLYCVPVAASGVATAGGSGIPDRATAGITLLASTSCSTYTPLGTAPLHMRARAQ